MNTLHALAVVTCSVLCGIGSAGVQPDIPGRRTTPAPAPAATPAPAAPVTPGDPVALVLEYTETVKPPETPPPPPAPAGGGGIIGVLEGKVTKPMLESGKAGAGGGAATTARATLTIPLRLVLVRDALGLQFGLSLDAGEGELVVDPRISKETSDRLAAETNTIFERLDRFLRIMSDAETQATQSSGVITFKPEDVVKELGLFKGEAPTLTAVADFTPKEVEKPVMRLVSPTEPNATQSLTTITGFDHLLLEVHAPRALAKTWGEEIVVMLSSTATGDDETLRIASYGSSGKGSVVYKCAGPFTLSAGGQGAGKVSVMGLEASRGGFTTLNTKNDDTVTFSADGVEPLAVRVYDSYVQKKIAANLASFDAIEPLLRKLLEDPRLSKEDKEVIHQKIRLIENGRIVAAVPPDKIEGWTDYTRMYMLDGYIRLIESDPREWDLRGRGRWNEAVGITCGSANENDLIGNAERQARETLHTRFAETMRDVTVASYQIFVSFTGSEALWILATDTDAMGGKVDRTRRILAGVETLANFAALGAGAIAAERAMIKPPPNARRALGEALSNAPPGSPDRALGMEYMRDLEVSGPAAQARRAARADSKWAYRNSGPDGVPAVVRPQPKPRPNTPGVAATPDGAPGAPRPAEPVVMPATDRPSASNAQPPAAAPTPAATPAAPPSATVSPDSTPVLNAPDLPPPPPRPARRLDDPTRLPPEPEGGTSTGLTGAVENAPKPVEAPTAGKPPVGDVPPSGAEVDGTPTRRENPPATPGGPGDVPGSRVARPTPAAPAPPPDPSGRPAAEPVGTPTRRENLPPELRPGEANPRVEDGRVPERVKPSETPPAPPPAPLPPRREPPVPPPDPSGRPAAEPVGAPPRRETPPSELRPGEPNPRAEDGRVTERLKPSEPPPAPPPAPLPPRREPPVPPPDPSGRPAAEPVGTPTPRETAPPELRPGEPNPHVEDGRMTERANPSELPPADPNRKPNAAPGEGSAPRPNEPDAGGAPSRREPGPDMPGAKPGVDPDRTGSVSGTGGAGPGSARDALGDVDASFDRIDYGEPRKAEAKRLEIDEKTGPASVPDKPGDGARASSGSRVQMGPGGRMPRPVGSLEGMHLSDIAPTADTIRPDRVFTQLPPAAAEGQARLGHFLYETADGHVYQLGDCLGQGTFSQVYRLGGEGNDGLVIKFRMQGEAQARPRPDAEIAADRAAGVRDIQMQYAHVLSGDAMVEMNRQASILLAGEKIEQAAVHSAHLNGRTPYLVAEEVRGPDVQMFKFKQFARTKDGRLVCPLGYTVKHQRAVAELYKKIAKAGLSAEDLHIENIYFRTHKDGTVVAGVLDHDRIAPYSDVYMEHMREDMISMQFRQDYRAKVRVESMMSHGRHTFEFRDAEHFMAAMLEHKGYITFDSATGAFRGSKIDMEALDGLFDVNQYVGANRVPGPPPAPKPGGWLTPHRAPLPFGDPHPEAIPRRVAA